MAGLSSALRLTPFARLYIRLQSLYHAATGLTPKKQA